MLPGIRCDLLSIAASFAVASVFCASCATKVNEVPPTLKARAAEAVALPEASSVTDNFEGKTVTVITQVGECSYRDYREFKRAGAVLAEAERGGWIFFVTSQTYDLHVAPGSSIMAMTLQRYKAPIRGRR